MKAKKYHINEFLDYKNNQKKIINNNIEVALDYYGAFNNTLKLSIAKIGKDWELEKLEEVIINNNKETFKKTSNFYINEFIKELKK